MEQSRPTRVVISDGWESYSPKRKAMTLIENRFNRDEIESYDNADNYLMQGDTDPDYFADLLKFRTWSKGGSEMELTENDIMTEYILCDCDKEKTIKAIKECVHEDMRSSVRLKMFIEWVLTMNTMK